MSTFKNLAGSCNVSSDFTSGNTPECLITNCQICNFTNELQIAIVHLVNVDEIIRGTSKMSFITRSTWLSTQVDCPDLRIFSHILSQGTCPSKKLSNMKDRKDYLNCCTIARYGMLVVPHHEPSSPTTEGILVPKHILAGLPTALPIYLDHSTQVEASLLLLFLLTWPRICPLTSKQKLSDLRVHDTDKKNYFLLKWVYLKMNS